MMRLLIFRRTVPKRNRLGSETGCNTWLPDSFRRFESGLVIPGIATERDGRQPFPVVEVARRDVAPGIAHRHRGGDLRARRDHAGSVDHRRGMEPLLIRSGDLEALQ